MAIEKMITSVKRLWDALKRTKIGKLAVELGIISSPWKPWSEGIAAARRDLESLGGRQRFGLVGSPDVGQATIIRRLEHIMGATAARTPTIVNGGGGSVGDINVNLPGGGTTPEMVRQFGFLLHREIQAGRVPALTGM